MLRFILKPLKKWKLLGVYVICPFFKAYGVHDFFLFFWLSNTNLLRGKQGPNSSAFSGYKIMAGRVKMEMAPRQLQKGTQATKE